MIISYEENFLNSLEEKREARRKLGKDPQGPAGCFVIRPETLAEKKSMTLYGERHIYFWGPIIIADWKKANTSPDFSGMERSEQLCPKCSKRKLVPLDEVYFQERRSFRQELTGNAMKIVTLACPDFDCVYAREVDATHGIIIRERK